MISDPKDWIAISLLPGIGPSRLSKLYFGGWTMDRLIATSPTSSSCPLTYEQYVQLADYANGSGLLWQQMQACDAALSACDGWVITPDHPNYPALLKSAPDCPVLLYGRGDSSALMMPQVAVVGSRSASAIGLRHAYQFSKVLAQSGFYITSGLALGIDGAAHQAALDMNQPTIAVMGTGVDRIYPHWHDAMAADILQKGGVLLSELPPGTAPLPAHFPRRNRIISGLSVGVLVVEAALKSGSLITARQALEQGREVFALPGPIDHPGSRGCHQLLREGAVLVERVDDIAAELGALLSINQAVDDEYQNSIPLDQKRILDAVDFTVTPLEQIWLRVGQVVTDPQGLLMELELSGWVEAIGGGYRRIR